MVRPSARPKVIQAALAVVEEHGIAALTLDAVAEEAGLTKRGLLYHFPSKHALLAGIHEDLAARTEQELIEATGREPEGASVLERTRGYVRASFIHSGTARRRLLMEAEGEPEWLAPWERVYRRWFPEGELPVEELDELSLRCLTARMAADGVWGYESILPSPLTAEARDRLAASILAPLEEA